MFEVARMIITAIDHACEVRLEACACEWSSPLCGVVGVTGGVIFSVRSALHNARSSPIDNNMADAATSIGNVPRPKGLCIPNKHRIAQHHSRRMSHTRKR